MTTETTRHDSWLSALIKFASEQGVVLPPFTGHAMGSARSEKGKGGRFITFKRRLVPATQAEVDGVEWTLWREQGELPIPVAVFREPLEPRHEDLTRALALLDGWLTGGWTLDEAKLAVRQHPRAREVEMLPPMIDAREERYRDAESQV